MPLKENIDTLQRAVLRFKVKYLDGHLALYSNSVIHHGFSSRIRPGVAWVTGPLHQSPESVSRHAD